MDLLQCLTGIGIFFGVIGLVVLIVSMFSRKSIGSLNDYQPAMPQLSSNNKAIVTGVVDDSQLFDGSVVPHPSLRRWHASQANTLVIEGVTEAVFMLYQSFSESLQGIAVVICSQPINAPEDVPPNLVQSSWYRLVYQIQDPEEYQWVRNVVAQVPPYVPLAAMELYVNPVAVNDHIPQPNERYVHPEVYLQ